MANRRSLASPDLLGPPGVTGRRPESYELNPSNDYLEPYDPYSPQPLRPISMEGEKTPLGSRPSTMTTTPNMSTIMGQYDSENDLVGHTHPKGYVAPGSHSVPRKSRSKKWVWLGLLIALLVIAGAVLGGVLGTQLNKKSGMNSSSDSNASNDTKNDTSTDTVTTPPSTDNNNSNTNNTKPEDPKKNETSSTLQTGTDGSVITTESGSKFTYVNKFGGSWAVDPANPYNASGQAQSYTPKIGEQWVWGKDTIRGVNLGGWLVTEPFIVPALYEEYQSSSPKAVDEYTLSQAMGKDIQAKMEEHYKTFITEQDFAEIAGAGLNWVRIAIGYWAIDTEDGEPYLKGVSWNYFLKAIEWARKYGLRILLDFHALPGSQNGWNHSGHAGAINWMKGPMGLANAQRSLEYIRTFVQYISQPGVKEVVPMIGLVNEVVEFDQTSVGSFYYQAYDMIRKMTGHGPDDGPIIAYHDGFIGTGQWSGFLYGADRLAVDQHLYQAFLKDNQGTGPVLDRTKGACGWGGGINDTQRDGGIVISGEWSLAQGDCGLWLNGVNSGPMYEEINGKGSCKAKDEWMSWNQTYKDDLKNHAIGQMDALQNWFFWTWKIGNSTQLGYPSCPMWHYQLGLKEGWIPEDPRVAGGWCQAQGYCQGCSKFDGKYPLSATGGVASPTIAADQMQKYGSWPPPAFATGIVPTLTQTGTPITLAGPTATFPGKGNGWAYPSDTVGAYTTVKGCDYGSEYDVNFVPTACNP